MTFEELREEIKKIHCDVKSDAVSFYFEAVFSEQQKAEIESLLNRYFGPPLKEAHQSPTPESTACAGRYGGAKENQTLYVKKNESQLNDVALLWPWTAGGRCTLKLIREQ